MYALFLDILTLLASTTPISLSPICFMRDVDIQEVHLFGAILRSESCHFVYIVVTFFVVCGWQDILDIKSPKKSPMLLRSAVFIFSMISVVFIFRVCIKQINTEARSRFMESNVIDNLTPGRLKQTHIPNILHYPEPLSFNR
jgi:hypothetical protein